METQTLTVGAMAGMPDEDNLPMYETDSEQDPAALLGGAIFAGECDVDLILDDPEPEVMEQLVAHERGILALYREYDQAPLRYGPRLAPHHPMMLACGKWMARQ